MGKLFDELKELKAAYDKKLRDEGQAAVGEAFKEVFDKFPELQSIVWTQYTPYFNDGDTCTFSVHDFSINFNEADASDYDHGESLYSLGKDPDKKALVDSVRALRKELPSDVLESVFEDHVKVVATREGFKVTECDHE